jgi:hypothetical protein
MAKKSRIAKATGRPKRKAKAHPKPAPIQPANTKLDRLAALLKRSDGASVAEMVTATGWQSHSVRGALAGALKRRGLMITSEKVGGIRRYRSGGAR